MNDNKIAQIIVAAAPDYAFKKSLLDEAVAKFREALKKEGK